MSFLRVLNLRNVSYRCFPNHKKETGMRKTIKIIHRVEAAINVNLFLYYFSKLPLIGRIVAKEAYADVDIKKTIRVIEGVLRGVKELVFKAVYLVLAMVLPIMVYDQGDGDSRYQMFLYLFFVLSILGTGLFNITLIEAKQQKYVAIQLMHIPAREYLFAKLCETYFIKFISYLPVLIIFTLILGGTVLQGILLAIYSALFHFTGEGIAAWYYKKKGKSISNWYIVVLVLLALLAAYIPVAFRIELPMEKLLFSLPMLLALVVPSILFLRYLYHYSEYEPLYYSTNQIVTLQMNKEQVSREAQFKGVKLKNKDYTQMDAKASELKHGNKKGYEYLNAIFFARHRRLFLKRDFYIIVGIAATVLIMAIALLAIGGVDYVDKVNEYSAVFIFIMYLISTMIEPTKAMFYNCDLSLLKFSFYREEKAVLKNFVIRFKYVILYNLIPAIAINLGLILLLVVSGSTERILELVPVLCLILVLSVFFAIFHLSVYYLLQPYTTELGIKNPLYKVVNSLLYILCYMCLQIKKPADIFLIAVLIGTILYSAVSMILVFKLAPKTFRVR